MIKTEKELLKQIRAYLTGNLKTEKSAGGEINVIYEKSYLLFSVLSLLKEKKQIKEFMYFTGGWYKVIMDNDNTINRQYQYANCTLVYQYPISYNEAFENILDNKYLHSNITNTTNVTCICSTHNKTIITFSIYGYFNFDKDGKCIDYDIINVDDDLYIFNSYDEFKQENSEIINILTKQEGEQLCMN